MNLFKKPLWQLKTELHGRVNKILHKLEKSIYIYFTVTKFLNRSVLIRIEYVGSNLRL